MRCNHEIKGKLSTPPPSESCTAQGRLNITPQLTRHRASPSVARSPKLLCFFPNCFRPDGKAYALATVGSTRRGNNNPGQKRIIIISKPLTSCSLLGCQPLFHHAGAFRVITSARASPTRTPAAHSGLRVDWIRIGFCTSR